MHMFTVVSPSPDQSITEHFPLVLLLSHFQYLSDHYQVCDAIYILKYGMYYVCCCLCSVDLDSHFTGDRANQSEQFYSVNDNGISASMDRILIHNSKHIDVHCTKT